MGCIQSKPQKPLPNKQIEDLAYLSAFPNGVPPPAPTPDKELEDLELEDEVDGDNADDGDSVLDGSSDDEGELFLGEEAPRHSSTDGDTAAGNRQLEGGKHLSFRHTHKLHVGVLEGTTFLNNYIVVDTLGRGSFGKVKLCLSVEDDSLYAVKVVDKRLIKQVAKSRALQGRFGRMTTAAAAAQHAAGEEPLADLRREVEVMRALNHPNLVKLYEVIDDKESGKILMVVELCEAGALVRPGQLTPDRRMPEAIAQFYFRQMASGLAYLHAHGVIHGDMKPENVLLSGDATVKIADFGQSQFMSEGEDTLRRTLGTPAYLAPEICAGEDYRGRPADVWALGVSLYAFIYGELPFRGTSLLELYEDIAEAVVPFPVAVPVSIELQDLLLRTLCKDPEARISAEEMLQHPWVIEDDLLTLMPSLFSDEAMMEGFDFESGAAAAAAAAAAGVSPRPLSPRFGGGSRNASAGASDRSLGARLGAIGESSTSGGDTSANLTPAGGSPLSNGGSSGGSRSFRGGVGGMVSPAAADVAAAVFPALFTGNNYSAGEGAYSLGPAASIVGALRQAQATEPPNRLGAHPSGRLHLLARDSIMHSSLSGDTTAADSSAAATAGGGGNDDESIQNNTTTTTKDRQNEDDEFSGMFSHSRTVSETSLEPGMSSGDLYYTDLGNNNNSNDTLSMNIDGGEASSSYAVVERSAPSAFTLMAQHAQQVQADMIVKRNQQQLQQQSMPMPISIGGPSTSRVIVERLETIEEVSAGNGGGGGGGSSFSGIGIAPRSSSVITAPADSQEIGNGEESKIKSIEAAAAASSPSPPATTPVTVPNSTTNDAATAPLAEPFLMTSEGDGDTSSLSGNILNESGTLPASSHSQLSLSFGEHSTMQYMMSSPFASDAFLSSGSMVPPPPPPQLRQSGSIQLPPPPPPPPSLGSGAATSIAQAVEDAIAIVDGENDEEESTTKNSATPPGGVNEHPPVAASKSGRLTSLLHKISFNKGSLGNDRDEFGNTSTLDTSGTGNDPTTTTTTITTTSSGGASTLNPPPPPPPVQPPPISTSQEPPIRWMLYRTGQKLAFYNGHSQGNTIYYIESGTVELRWEATLPVPLTSVLSTMNNNQQHNLSADQQRPSMSSSADNSLGRTSTSGGGGKYLSQADSLAFSSPHVRNLARTRGHGGSSGSTGSGSTGPHSSMERADTMTLTLQQATQRAEALMMNAAGGSLDNLLLSERGAAQYLGALSMLDPDFFADRWKASAVAQTEVVAIRMTREGLDHFLAQNPLAQVHLRASMARGRAEITKLEALERIAEAHRRTRSRQLQYKQQKEKQQEAMDYHHHHQHQRKRSMINFSDLGKVFGATMAEVAEAAINITGGGGTSASAAASGQQEQQQAGGGSRGGRKDSKTAGLDIFALVSKLRTGAQELYPWDAITGAGGGASSSSEKK